MDRSRLVRGWKMTERREPRAVIEPRGAVGQRVKAYAKLGQAAQLGIGNKFAAVSMLYRYNLVDVTLISDVLGSDKTLPVVKIQASAAALGSRKIVLALANPALWFCRQISFLTGWQSGKR